MILIPFHGSIYDLADFVSSDLELAWSSVLRSTDCGLPLPEHSSVAMTSASTLIMPCR